MVVNSMSYATYDSYKDSGVDWLGKIPSDWDLLKVKNIFRLVMKFAPKNNDCELLSVYTDIGVKPRKELEERGNRATTTDGYLIVEKGDIVVNKLLAWMGAIGLSDYDGVTSPAYDVLKPKMPIEGIFYHLLFRSPQCTSELKRHSRGIMDMRLRLYFDKFGDVVVPYPNIEVQKKIVSFLAEKTAQIDQAIALKQQQIEKLNEYKQIVIQNAVTKGLNPNAPMKNSGVEWIGNIPEHWDVKKNTHLFNKIGSGTTPTSSDLSYYDSGDINWLQTGDLNNDYIVATSRKINQKAMSKFSSLKLYDENSLVIAMYGATIGKVGLLKIKSTTNQACCVLGNSDKVFMKYIFYVMQFAKNHLISNSYGGGQPNINQDMIKNLRIPYPNLQEQEKIANYLDDLNEKIYKTSKGYQTQIDRLKEYKNILINQAVTGKIKI
ncbi:restriction endonuclease subunit S (plasmid) [Moraxella osloensis]|uniref:Restriction endonuclease subunit S n=1 Tax=Faucicola osloensis TaxID=34062 RepID=A0A2D2EAE5_FAUOS|nr:restriction endonuclease subunit S [Moraxella osloensis]ATQ86212.1 restriction endonuclease subunit S [Moraxella osloensis]ATW86757.1 restriction endonuclease subunit S [Moraxella osloensis]